MSGSDPTIVDEEIVVLRIPSGAPWFEPPDRVSSANFKLDRRRGERGLSVYRLSVVSPAEVLTRPGAIPGSFLVAASVGSIRALRNAEGTPLSLDVLADDDEGRNPGHAEIRGPEAGKLSPSASRALQRLFERLPDADA